MLLAKTGNTIIFSFHGRSEWLPFLITMIRISTSKDRKKPRKNYYVCNQQRCFVCKGKQSECRHTTDIRFAKYADHDPDEFDLRFDAFGNATFWEKIRNGS